MPKQRTSLSLEPELIDRVRRLAERAPGGTMSAVVETALEMYLPHLEAMVAAAEAEPERREEAAMESLMRSFLHTLQKGDATT